MPLVAMNERNERVELWRYDSTEQLLAMRKAIRDGKKAYCPDCGGEMVIKAIDSDYYVAHFAHVPNPDNVCEYGRGESKEHLLAKSEIAKHISRFEMYQGASVHVEYKIDIPNGASPYRIADVVAVFDNGEIHVHEAQLASISHAQLEERTNDYRKATTEVVWWLGNNAKTRANIEWLENNAEIYGEIEIRKSRIEITH